MEMKLSKLTPLIFLISVSLIGTACNKFVIEGVNYSQEVESVLEPDENGNVEDVRHDLTFNINPLLKEEFGEGEQLNIEEIRLIRNAEGFYFITAKNFRHVYVMKPGHSNLKLENKIRVSDDRLISPAFNYRDGIVQLVNTGTNDVYALRVDGIEELNQEG